MGSVTADERRRREDAIRQLMAFKGEASPTALRRLLAEQEQPIHMTTTTIRRVVTAIKNDNMRWLSDLAKVTYISDMRQRYDWLKDAMLRTHVVLQDPEVKDHARAQLNNSLGTLNAEITALAENGGLYRYMHEWMNAPETEAAAAAQEEHVEVVPPPQD